MRKLILSIYEYWYKYCLPYDRSGLEQWKKYLGATPLDQIEEACQKEGLIFQKHTRISKEKKKAANGKYYTIIPPRLAEDLRRKWQKECNEIKSKDPGAVGVQMWAIDLFQTETIECTGHYIDTLALPIVKAYKDKKRCPIEQCSQKYELKEKQCYLGGTHLLIEHLNIVTNKNGHRIPYLLDMKICTNTKEPYLIELIPKILVMEIDKIPDQFPNDLTCPYCTCDKKESVQPLDSRHVTPFSSFDFDLLGGKVYFGKSYICWQCSQKFETFFIPSSSFEILESRQGLLKEGKFDLFKKYMNESDI